jgi:hypothetical protein
MTVEHNEPAPPRFFGLYLDLSFLNSDTDNTSCAGAVRVSKIGALAKKNDSKWPNDAHFATFSQNHKLTGHAAAQRSLGSMCPLHSRYYSKTADARTTREHKRPCVVLQPPLNAAATRARKCPHTHSACAERHAAGGASAKLHEPAANCLQLAEPLTTAPRDVVTAHGCS